MNRAWLTRLAWLAMIAVAAGAVFFAGWFIWLLANVPKFSNYHMFGAAQFQSVFPNDAGKATRTMLQGHASIALPASPLLTSRRST